MEIFENICMVRRFGGTRRFHAERFVGPPETVFHHSASVALILMMTEPERCTANLLKAAICHDLEEGLTGDIPAPAKWASGNVFEELEHRIREFYKIPHPELTEEELQLLKAADFLDCSLTCLDQRMMGNRFIDNVFENLDRYQAKCINELKDLFGASDKMRRLWRQTKAEYHECVICRGSLGPQPFWEANREAGS